MEVAGSLELKSQKQETRPAEQGLRAAWEKARLCGGLLWALPLPQNLDAGI